MSILRYMHVTNPLEKQEKLEQNPRLKNWACIWIKLQSSNFLKFLDEEVLDEETGELQMDYVGINVPYVYVAFPGGEHDKASHSIQPLHIEDEWLQRKLFCSSIVFRVAGRYIYIYIYLPATLNTILLQNNFL